MKNVGLWFEIKWKSNENKSDKATLFDYFSGFLNFNDSDNAAVIAEKVTEPSVGENLDNYANDMLNSEITLDEVKSMKGRVNKRKA